jgi:Zn finger protein HypA/HybF involved in hydrogenase expression
MVTAVDEVRFVEALENHEGWCSTCGDFTRECTEPDAEHYKCPQCQGMTVMGAEWALLSGEVTFAGEEGGVAHAV